jgi:transcriptional regulator with XRE-family HTH domain
MLKKLSESTDKYVGGKVRTRRLMLNMSQTALANQIGVTSQQVQKYENGTNRISASRLQQIANVLHEPVHYFFEGNPEYALAESSGASLPTYEADLLANRDGIALIKAFVRIKDPILRRKIINLIEELASQGSQVRAGDHPSGSSI